MSHVNTYEMDATCVINGQLLRLYACNIKCFLTLTGKRTGASSILESYVIQQLELDYFISLSNCSSTLHVLKNRGPNSPKKLEKKKHGKTLADTQQFYSVNCILFRVFHSFRAKGHKVPSYLAASGTDLFWPTALLWRKRATQPGKLDERCPREFLWRALPSSINFNAPHK